MDCQNAEEFYSRFKLIETPEEKKEMISLFMKNHKRTTELLHKTEKENKMLIEMNEVLNNRVREEKEEKVRICMLHEDRIAEFHNKFEVVSKDNESLKCELEQSSSVSDNTCTFNSSSDDQEINKLTETIKSLKDLKNNLLKKVTEASNFNQKLMEEKKLESEKFAENLNLKNKEVDDLKARFDDILNGPETCQKELITEMPKLPEIPKKQIKTQFLKKKEDPAQQFIFKLLRARNEALREELKHEMSELKKDKKEANDHSDDE